MQAGARGSVSGPLEFWLHLIAGGQSFRRPRCLEASRTVSPVSCPSLSCFLRASPQCGLLLKASHRLGNAVAHEEAKSIWERQLGFLEGAEPFRARENAQGRAEERRRRDEGVRSLYDQKFVDACNAELPEIREQIFEVIKTKIGCPVLAYLTCPEPSLLLAGGWRSLLWISRRMRFR